MKNNKVAVIGGGIAGISAAVKLSLAGYKVDLFESRSFLGGRTYSFNDKITGVEIDNGQHLFMGAYNNFFELLEILDTKKYLKFEKGIDIDFIDLLGKTASFKTSIFPGKIGMLFGLFCFNLLTFTDKLKAIKFLFKIRNIAVENVNQSVFELLKTENQSDNSINSFWEPMCLAVMNTSVKVADASIFVVVLKMAFMGSSSNSALVFSRVGLSKLIEPAEDLIKKNGGQVHYNEKIIQLNIINKNVISFETNIGVYKYDYYISAIPLYVLIKLNDFMSESLNYQFDYSTIISAYLWFDKEFPTSKITALINSEVQWVFNRKNITMSAESSTHDTSKGHIALTISGANNLDYLSNQELLDLILNNLERAYPNINDMNIIRSKIIKDRKATISLSPEFRNFRNQLNIILDNLYLAGDWTNTGLPATIEGACLSGFRSAEQVKNDFLLKNSK